MRKTINLPIKKIKGKERSVKAKKSTNRYIMAEMLTAEDSHKLESSKRKPTHPQTFRIAADFSSETVEARGGKMAYSKCGN